jgi:hypothetical protein
MRGFIRFSVPAAVLVSGLVSPAAATPPGHEQSVGKPWPLPAQPAPDPNLATLGGPAAASQSAPETEIAAASARARATGAAVAVTGLTTETTTVTAEPNGTETVTDYVLPVRVRSGSRWVPVDTALRQVPGGRLAPEAIPGDAVTFSGGGGGPMALVTTSGTSLALSWPGPLPVPVVAGPTATYRNVLPGVDLALTATSSAAGGFSEVLVVRTPAAARDPGLASLALRVATSGTGPLQATVGGGLAAPMTRGGGSYVAALPSMWDSSQLPLGSTKARSAAVSAASVGGGLAAMGAGPRSSVGGPAGGARLARVGTRVLAGGKTLALAPDERMLASSSTRFPVYIDPGFTTVNGTGRKQAYDPVLSQCPGSNYNSSAYPYSPVGYDDFEAGNCQYNDTDYALYQVAIPSGTFGSHSVLIAASFQAAEVYTSSCANSPSVTASWTGGINSGTGWPGPGIDGDNVNATDTVGPDAGSCNSVEGTSDRVAAGFNLKPDLAKFSGAASNLTVRLWEPGDANEDDHKQFTDNPDLQVTYTETPNAPGGLEEAATSSGSGSLDCDTSPASPDHRQDGLDERALPAGNLQRSRRRERAGQPPVLELHDLVRGDHGQQGDR